MGKAAAAAAGIGIGLLIGWLISTDDDGFAKDTEKSGKFTTLTRSMAGLAAKGLADEMSDMPLSDAPAISLLDIPLADVAIDWSPFPLDAVEPMPPLEMPRLDPGELGAGLVFADQILTGYGNIADAFDTTTRNVRDALHVAKDDKIVRAGKFKNPDLGVDRTTGEIYIELPDGGFSEDSIGNIQDILERITGS